MENFPHVLGVLAGGDLDRDLVLRWAQSADRILAADAAADLLFSMGISPDVVIGDMDSISEQSLRSAKEQVRIPDQDTTDCDKLLARAAEEGHKSITLAGVEGDLPDHVLAILHSSASSKLEVKLAYRRGIGSIVKPHREVIFKTQPGRRASLLALEPCHGVHFEGVAWSLRNAKLSIEEGTSISNRTEGEEVRVSIGQGAALLFVEFPVQEMPIW